MKHVYWNRQQRRDLFLCFFFLFTYFSKCVNCISWRRSALRYCKHAEPILFHPLPQQRWLPPSIPPSFSLIMAWGPDEQTTEVNATQKRGAALNEAEVKMSGWSRQIKEMRDEADVWWVHLKRDWHMRGRERTWKFQFESAVILFFPDIPWSLLLWHFTPNLHYSDHYWRFLLTHGYSLLSVNCAETQNLGQELEPRPEREVSRCGCVGASFHGSEVVNKSTNVCAWPCQFLVIDNFLLCNSNTTKCPDGVWKFSEELCRVMSECCWRRFKAQLNPVGRWGIFTCLDMLDKSSYLLF